MGRRFVATVLALLFFAAGQASATVTIVEPKAGFSDGGISCILPETVTIIHQAQMTIDSLICAFLSSLNASGLHCRQVSGSETSRRPKRPG